MRLRLQSAWLAVAGILSCGHGHPRNASTSSSTHRNSPRRQKRCNRNILATQSPSRHLQIADHLILNGVAEVAAVIVHWPGNQACRRRLPCPATRDYDINSACSSTAKSTSPLPSQDSKSIIGRNRPPLFPCSPWSPQTPNTATLFH